MATTKGHQGHQGTPTTTLQCQGIYGSMEGYTTKRCYLGTHPHLVVVSTPSTLRTRLFFQGGRHVRITLSGARVTESGGWLVLVYVLGISLVMFLIHRH